MHGLSATSGLVVLRVCMSVYVHMFVGAGGVSAGQLGYGVPVLVCIVDSFQQPW